MKLKAALRICLIVLFALSLSLLTSCGESFVVTFDTDGGSEVESVETKSGGLVSEPTTEKEGYTFIGWYYNSDKWDFAHYSVTKNITLRAKWLKNYTVSFDSKGGSAVSAITVPDGSLISAPAVPVKENAEFIGWYLGAAKWDFSSDTVNKDITLEAKWTDIYTVKFESNGGTFIDTLSIKHGGKATEPSAPERLGYKFAGWFVDGTDTEWNFNSPVTENLVLSAKWIQLFTVTFDTNGAKEKLDPVQLEAGSLIKEPKALTNEGYVFDGWYLGETPWNFSSDTLTKNITLTAKWVFKSYTVSFNTGSDTLIESQKVVAGKTAAAPTAPTKTGYKFIGWYIGEEKYDFQTPVSADITLSAKWAELCTVIFSLDGTEYKTLTVTRGSKIPKPAQNPSKLGYEFIGWTLGGVLWDFNKTITANVTLTASFREIFTVSFDTDGGEGEYASVSVPSGSALNFPAKNPTKTGGYVFDYWYYLNEENEAVRYNFALPVSQNLTLYAKWAKIYTVSFNADNGEEIYTITVREDDFLQEPAPAPSKKYYEFDGWYTNTNEKIEFGSFVNCDLELTAHWKENFYEITFLVGTEIYETIRVDKSDANPYIEAPEDPIKENMGFGGWYNGANRVTFPHKVTKNLSLEARFNEIYFTVTYKGAGADGTDLALKVVINEKAPYKTLEKPGFTLTGWKLDGESAEYNFDTPVTQDITLVPIFKACYTVSYDTDGGEALEPESVIEGNKITKIPTPKKANHRFLGWYIGNEPFDFNTEITENVTLTAKWKKIVSVSFNLAGGEGDITNPAPFDAGGKVARPEAEPTQTGYKFLGWFVGEVEYDFDTPVNESIIIYAKWAKIYTVSFNLAGGEGEIAPLNTLGGKITEPTKPTKAGYKFVQWYYLDASNQKCVWNFDTSSVTANITLIAEWEITEIKVTFDLNGGTFTPTDAVNEIILQYGEKISAPEGTILKENASFIGWYLGNEEYDFDTPVTESITLTAKWEGAYTVKFELDGGSYNGGAIPDVNILAGGKITAPDAALLKKGNHVFKYWSKKGENVAYDFNTPVNEDITLVAQWTYVCTLKFELDGGVLTDAYKEREVLSGERTERPANPSRPTYEFLGWYYIENGVKKSWNFTERVTADMVIYAEWKYIGEVKYTVTFDSNGGSGTFESQTVVSGGTVTKPATDPEINNPVYKFAGWYDENGRKWNFDVDTVTKNVTLTAFWIRYGEDLDTDMVGPFDEVDKNTEGPIDPA